MSSLAALQLPSATDFGSRADLAAAKRNVRAILIAGDQVGTPGVPTPGATDSLDIIEQDLNARFALSGIKIDRLVGTPTKQLVTNAFEAMKPIVKSDELFVVMYAGHGKPITGPRTAQAWALTGDDVFTDLDLATTLLAFPPRVDTVVISDCCYGEGMFRIDDLGSRRTERSSRNTPMVCISGAGTSGLVELSKLANLAKEIVAAAAASQSYHDLSGTFAATAVAGRTFHVDARPAGRLGDPVLSTGGRAQERVLAGHAAVLPIR